MPNYYCFVCGAQREHLNVKRTAELAQVTRATIYNWLHAGRLHVIAHPSGRKFICTASVLAHHTDLGCEEILPAAAHSTHTVVALEARRPSRARFSGAPARSNRLTVAAAESPD